jgi:type I restriction enzyme S subunit
MDRLDTQNLKFIDLEPSRLLERSALTQPTILMTFIGAGIGDVAVFNLIEQRWHLAPNVAKLEPFNHYGEKIDIRYLLLFLMSKTGRDEIFKQRKSTAQPSLSMETLRDINVIVPPLAEQKRIVAKVDELMQLCDQLEASLRQSQQRAENLAASAISHLTI